MDGTEPRALANWLHGVTRADGGTGWSARQPGLGFNARIDGWVTSHKLPVGDAVAVGIE